MIVNLRVLKAGLKTVNSEDLLPFFRFKYFISQPGIIHWINVWAAPFGKRLAVRTYPVFLLERRPLMLGAWLALRQRFLQRETLVGSSCCGWARLEQILSLAVWVETLLQQSAAAGTGPEWSKQEWETFLVRAPSLTSCSGLTQSPPVSGVLNHAGFQGQGLWAPGAGGISLGMDLIAGIYKKGFVSVKCLFTLSNDDLYGT